MFYFSRKTKSMIALGIVMLFFAVLLSFINQGCAGLNSSSLRTPQSMLDIYNSQFAEYMRQTGYQKQEGVWVKIKTPVLSEDQKKVLRTKKEILTEVFPLIQTYNFLIETEGTYDPELEAKINGLLDHLLMILLE